MLLPRSPQVVAKTPSAWLLVLATFSWIGCGSGTPTAKQRLPPTEVQPTDQVNPPNSASPTQGAIELDADALLAATLSVDEAAQGWIRLFDGQTTFGWQIAGDANFHVENGEIMVDSGENCLMCTTAIWTNYELTLEFQADGETNSGVFVRTPLVITDPATQCYEINIAPPSNPFPTGSVVGRGKASEFNFTGDWHRMTILCNDAKLTVTIDDQSVVELTDATAPAAGHIGLQHNAGRVAFRDVRLRPLGFESLLDDEFDRWTRPEDQPGTMEMTEDGLLVDGGKQYAESKEQYDDFTLLARYQMENPASNSGLFFRCIPGESMNGYECQVNDSLIDNDRLRPADGGTGGIFRRSDARIVAGTPGQDNVVLCHVNGPHIATWVNGLQVADLTDTRPADANPRRGTRTEAGTLQIQGHDETTRVSYQDIKLTTP